MTGPSLAERGRRAGAAALLVVVSAGVAQTIVTNPEPTSAALPGPVPTIAATTRGPAAPSAASSATTRPAKPATSTATAKPVDPRAVAVAWYAERHRLDRSSVQALQADRLRGPAVRYQVLLLVAKPGGRLDSAVVTVTRSGRAWRAEASRG